MRIIITRFAKGELKAIYSYYEKVASPRVALNLTNKILDVIENLKQSPYLGTREPNLSALGLKHKYLVVGNYKIIFRREEKAIYVTDIFDARQDPAKIALRNV